MRCIGPPAAAPMKSSQTAARSPTANIARALAFAWQERRTSATPRFSCCLEAVVSARLTHTDRLSV